MNETIWGVVCVHPSGHRTIVRTSDRSRSTKEELQAWGAKRDRHPNAVALRFRHEVVVVHQTAAGTYTEASL